MQYLAHLGQSILLLLPGLTLVTTPCYDVTTPCYDVTTPCYDVTTPCYDVTTPCYDVTTPCYDVTTPCYDVTTPCYDVTTPCYDVTFSCTTASCTEEVLVQVVLGVLHNPEAEVQLEKRYLTLYRCGSGALVENSQLPKDSRASKLSQLLTVLYYLNSSL